jgi:integrase
MKADDFAKKPVPSKAEAGEVWLPKFITEIREDRDPTQPAGESPVDQVSTVEQLVPIYLKRHCEAEGLSLNGLKPRLSGISKYFGTVPLKKLEKPGPVEDFKAHLLEKGRAAATVNRYLAQLRHMINWAIDHELMERTPFLGRGRGVRLLREDNQRYRRLASDEETRLFKAATDEPMMTERIIVALDTGMRRGEMLLLQNKHVLWGEDLIRVIAANTKTHRERRIPIGTTRLRSVLERRRFLGPEAYILGNEIGERRTEFRTAWLRILANAKITDRDKGLEGDLHWHDLRHECGSRLGEGGVPIHEIQHLMGHSVLVTTQRYLNATVDSLKKSVKVLERQAG